MRGARSFVLYGYHDTGCVCVERFGHEYVFHTYTRAEERIPTIYCAPRFRSFHHTGEVPSTEKSCVGTCFQTDRAGIDLRQFLPRDHVSIEVNGINFFRRRIGGVMGAKFFPDGLARMLSLIRASQVAQGCQTAPVERLGPLRHSGDSPGLPPTRDVHVQVAGGIDAEDEPLMEQQVCCCACQSGRAA